MASRFGWLLAFVIRGACFCGDAVSTHQEQLRPFKQNYVDHLFFFFAVVFFPPFFTVVFFLPPFFTVVVFLPPFLTVVVLFPPLTVVVFLAPLLTVVVFPPPERVTAVFLVTRVVDLGL